MVMNISKKILGYLIIIIVIAIVAVFAFREGITKENMDKIDYATFFKNVNADSFIFLFMAII